LVRFIVYELIAFALLVTSVAIGLSHRMPTDPLSFIAKILTIAAAVALAVIPIIFYGLPETLPGSRR
jgi:type IV secretory pathway VirB2 component (pilin)